VLKRLCTVGLLIATLAFAKDEGFEGKWMIDKGASTATCDIPDALTQRIKKKGDGYEIETVWKEPRNGIAPLVLLGVMTTNFKLGGPGKDTVNQVGPFMQNTRTTYSADQLITEWTAHVEGKPVNGKWTRTLSPDGRTMTLEIQESSADGNSGNAKLVFTRK
jgi:hypothetical protein